MTSVNKRLEKLERNIPQPVPSSPSNAELTQRLVAEIDELLALGYATQAGDLSPDCPTEQRSMAILGGVFLKGKL